MRRAVFILACVIGVGLLIALIGRGVDRMMGPPIEVVLTHSEPTFSQGFIRNRTNRRLEAVKVDVWKYEMYTPRNELEGSSARAKVRLPLQQFQSGRSLNPGEEAPFLIGSSIFDADGISVEWTDSRGTHSSPVAWKRAN